MEIKRVFERRETETSEGGRVGHVKMVIPDGDWTLNGKKLPVASVEWLATFALQAFQDAYAGQKTVADSKAVFDKKVAACIAGEIGVRGEGVSSETAIARRLARAVIKAQNTKDAYKAFGDKPTAEQNAVLDAAIEANAAHFKKAVAAEIKRLEAERNAKREAAEAVTITL